MRINVVFIIVFCETSTPHRGALMFMLVIFSAARRTRVRLRVEENAILPRSRKPTACNSVALQNREEVLNL